MVAAWARGMGVWGWCSWAQTWGARRGSSSGVVVMVGWWGWWEWWGWGDGKDEGMRGWRGEEGMAPRETMRAHVPWGSWSQATSNRGQQRSAGAMAQWMVRGQSVRLRTAWGMCHPGTGWSAPLRASSGGHEPLGSWRAALCWAPSTPLAPDTPRAHPDLAASVCRQDRGLTGSQGDCRWRWVLLGPS